jgi:hypothetical protein
MASTYTTDLAIQLMATGENAGTWGQITNTNLVVIQQAIAGYQDISIAGGAQTTALVMTQNALANARNAVIKLSGTITGNQIVTVPNGIDKTWIISNGTTGAFTVTFKYASTGSGQTWSTTDKGIKILYADGTDIRVTDLSTLSGQVVSAQIADFAVNTAELATNAVTAIKITQSTITQAKLASNSVGATQIIQSTITQAKLAANSVGPNQLISTGVTAASYASPTITIDADGRITAATAGSAGKLIQTVQATTTSAVSKSSSSFSTYFSASITPTSASNYIMIIAQVYGINNNYEDRNTSIQIARGSTLLFPDFPSGDGITNRGFAYSNNYGGSGGSVTGPNAKVQGVIMDSPATTSSTTYNIQYKDVYGDRVAYVGRDNPTSRLTLIEVAP